MELQTPAAETRVLGDAAHLQAFMHELEGLQSRALPQHLDLDPSNAEKGLAKLVLTLVDFLRQLMERQALRRMETGSLTDHEVEQLGQTFLLLEKRLCEMQDLFGLENEELNLSLGPLGRLL